MDRINGKLCDYSYLYSPSVSSTCTAFGSIFGGIIVVMGSLHPFEAYTFSYLMKNSFVIYSFVLHC